MAGSLFSMDFKSAQRNFFDTAKVQRAVDKATRKVLSKFGAFVRTTARGSIKRSPGYSNPGEPPHSHVGLLKKFILFSYGDRNKSVVIGPTLLRGAKSGGMTTVPQILEEGGSQSTSEVLRRTKGRRRRRAVYRARPYMEPAFQKNLPTLPAMWAGSVK